ncbi:MAG: hypothetical protein WKF75_12835 [Singulisphaera sp.]
MTAIHVAAVHAKLGFRTVTRPFPLSRWRTPWAAGRHARRPGAGRPGPAGAAGIAVVVEERAVTPLPAPRRRRARRGADRAVLDFVRGHERASSASAPTSAREVVAQLRLAFPGDDRRGRDPARRRPPIRPDPQVDHPGACWSLGDDFPADPGPLVVSTYMGLSTTASRSTAATSSASTPARLGQDACLAIGTPTGRPLRVLGRDERLAPDRDRTRRVQLRRAGRPATATSPAPSRPASPGWGGDAAGPDVAAQASGHLGQPVRNRRVARLAKALAGGDGPGLAAESPAIAAWAAGMDIGVIVLVEASSMRLALADRLPGWGPWRAPRHHGGPPAGGALLEGGTGGRGRPAARSRPWRAWPRPTSRRPTSSSAPTAARIPEAGSGCPCRTPRAGLLLVDLDDRHHPSCGEAGPPRGVSRPGLAVDGTAGPSSPLDVFLSTRPGRGS